MTEAPGAEPWLLYDGGCPFCSTYVRKLRLRDSAPPVRLADARDGGPEFEEARAAGLDVDGGMVLKLGGEDGGRLYYGADVIRRLALLSTSSGRFNRLTGWIFRSETRARLLYPWLRRGRNLTLALLGRSGIDHHSKGGGAIAMKSGAATAPNVARSSNQGGIQK